MELFFKCAAVRVVNAAVNIQTANDSSGFFVQLLNCVNRRFNALFLHDAGKHAEAVGL